MTTPGWTIAIEVRCTPPHYAEWIARALRPEAAREVPRTRTDLTTSAPGHLELAIVAHDSGAARAAMNTYLGWLQLVEQSLGVAAGHVE
jgi:tRNA threonylcarbamoyladenosine modification (KEOPS) complex  Pcc1 subunit